MVFLICEKQLNSYHNASIFYCKWKTKKPSSNVSLKEVHKSLYKPEDKNIKSHIKSTLVGGEFKKKKKGKKKKKQYHTLCHLLIKG